MKWTSLIALAVMIGCGGEPTPREACEQAAVAACERIYTCYTAAELAVASFPATESACVTMTQVQRGCAAKTVANACDGNETWHASDADLCIDQVSGLECSQIRATNFNVQASAPACERACRVD